MATIFCFSATGNSLYVAKRISKELSCEVISMTSPITECSDSVIGFVFPTFFLGLPTLVENFIKNLQITHSDAYIFAVATCGAFVFDLDGVVQKVLKPKRLTLNYFAKVRSIQNLPSLYKSINQQKIHQKVDERLQKVILDIKNKKNKIIKPVGLLNHIRIQHYITLQKMPCDSFFTVENCKGCGMCKQICPNHNISLIENSLAFHGDCQLCLACLHICPQSAINWKNTSQDKPRYTHPSINKSELIQFINET